MYFTVRIFCNNHRCDTLVAYKDGGIHIEKLFVKEWRSQKFNLLSILASLLICEVHKLGLWELCRNNFGNF